ncbi:hypothetical protein V6x_51310 [Gimesia chilikensis]|uniref:Glycosyltransferase RgtA/B/C/D-like domain-containing protein n=1 Tax=Gimesia chilikensis TaxID=2605989 RepID=A0A517WJG4_9PLAN|nr:glycosyltransferase family 39 protein [Gimesia chilikensis]QDU05394.1 hypothetical protein V6x_51310 [Gimesia chilikensis]
MTEVNSSEKITSKKCNLEYLWLGIVLLIAAIFRFAYLNQVSYWFDESFTLKMVEFPLLDMMERNMHDDDNPPLYYLTLKLWVSLFGNYLTAPRILSALCSMTTVAGTYFLVKEAYQTSSDSRPKPDSRYAALLAAVLVSLSPLQISWAQQVRMYAMAPTFAVWSSYFLFRAMFRKNSGKGSWILFTLLSVLQAYTHYFGLFIAIAQYGFALGYVGYQRLNPREKKVSLQTVLISGITFYFLFLPWLLVFLEHRERVDVKMPTADITWPYIGTRLAMSFDLQWFYSVTPVTGVLVAQFFLIVFLMLAIQRRPADYFLILTTLLPFLAAAIVSLYMRTVFVPRYLISAQVFALISIAVAVSNIPWKLFRRTGILLVLMAMGWLAKEQFLTRTLNASLPGMRGAVTYLNDQREVDETVIVCNPMLFTSIVFYIDDRDQLFTQGTPRGYPYFQGTAVMRDDEYLQISELKNQSHTRIWTFDADKWFGHTWMVNLPPGWHEVSRKRFQEFNADFIIRCYEHQPPNQVATDVL